MDVNQAQNEFQTLISKLPSSGLGEFFSWIQHNYLAATCGGERPAIAYMTMQKIAHDIREKVPLNAICPSENITFPSTGKNSDCDALHTVHIDAFLYDEVDIDDLVSQGKISRQYCLDCNSNNIGDMTFISHSASRRRIEFLFSSFLSNVDFTDKTVLDVGSRLGAVLYGAYLYTEAKQIIGVEMNKQLCDVQEYIIGKYNLSDRIKVICDDICNASQIIQSSHVIILNNVFEFFQNKPKQVEAWKCLRANIKSGTVLVTIPSLEDSLKELPETGIDLSNWVRKREFRNPLLAMSIQDMDELSEICVYDII